MADNKYMLLTDTTHALTPRSSVGCVCFTYHAILVHRVAMERARVVLTPEHLLHSSNGDLMSIHSPLVLAIIVRHGTWPRCLGNEAALMCELINFLRAELEGVRAEGVR